METKLRRFIIGFIAGTFVLAIGMTVAWNMVLIKPLKKEIEEAGKSYTAEKEVADRLPEALKKETQAVQNLVLVKEQFSYFQKRYRSLNFDLTTEAAREVTWQKWMDEYFEFYGIELRRELLEAADVSGVVINTSVKVDPPPQLPEQVAAPPNGLMKPVTGGILSVDITGTLPELYRFFERINQSAILMTLGTIKLSGSSPDIRASFTITPYLLAVGPSVTLPAAPTAVTEAAGAVAGAAGAAGAAVAGAGAPAGAPPPAAP